ncbi:hyalin-like [Strongylocentrotus purpuratus]|uniref:HYR domain-containing protein n=1 Tax=Strongylocentrotus purpuratus TaxID=7668 RepID=A0A7M7PJG0_STRPU|nr:hyalin-like [Strongylocentrotus purpuratus]
MELCSYHLSITRTYVWICVIFFILCNGANGQDVTCNSVESERSNVFATFNVAVSGTANYNLIYEPAEYGPNERLPVGTNEVTVTAYPTSSPSTATGSCIFNVTVSLQELPIVCPEPVDLNIGTDSGEPFYTYQDPQFNVTYLPESTTYDPYGSITMMRTYGGSSSSPRLDISQTAHTVTVTITDGTLSKACTEARVSVEDREPPVIVCPDDVYQDHTSVESTAFQLKGISDNSGELYATAIQPFINPRDGYPVGTTTYTFTVSDRAGNDASCSFNVTIEIGPQTPTLQGKNSLYTFMHLFIFMYCFCIKCFFATNSLTMSVSSMTSSSTPFSSSIPVTSSKNHSCHDHIFYPSRNYEFEFRHVCDNSPVTSMTTT